MREVEHKGGVDGAGAGGTGEAGEGGEPHGGVVGAAGFDATGGGAGAEVEGYDVE